ncbi:hypothetical protein LPY66_16035 [Dehalobacter sp. DCM]|uniref:hypothetical protein n=1 Tax=Dehalobacter sp. DCM TaxID=2907827 RepID=UPI003082087D|nr:hypothetical protein LPY66_16035 [Dehalobacter sp. DCM]
MAQTLPSGIILPDSNDNVTRAANMANLQKINELILKAGVYLGEVAGTNIYTSDFPLDNYVDGMLVVIKIGTGHTNTGASTLNINGKGALALKNGKGLDFAAGKLEAGKQYPFRLNGTSFLLQGEGGEYGTATADKVLYPYTVGTENGLVQGTIPNNGELYYMPASVEQYAPAGYITGGVVAGDADLVAGNIKAGVSIFGVNGTLPEPQGVLTNFAIDTGETIAAGDFVRFSKSISTGSANTLATSASAYYSCVKLTATTALVVYDNKAVVITISSGTVISAGTPLTYTTNATLNSVALLSSTKALVCYADSNNGAYGTAVVLTISGTTVTAGTPSVFNSTLTPQSICAIALSDTKALVMYCQDNSTKYGAVKVVTISGTSLSFGTAAVFQSSDTSYITSALINTSSVLVCYSVGATGYAVVFTVSGTTVTVNTSVSGIGYYNLQISLLNSTRAFVVCKDYSTSGIRGCFLTISGTTITKGADALGTSGSLDSVTYNLVTLARNTVLLVSIQSGVRMANYVIDVDYDKQTFVVNSGYSISTPTIYGAVGATFDSCTSIAMYTYTSLFGARVLKTNYAKKTLAGGAIGGIAKTAGVAGQYIDVYMS